MAPEYANTGLLNEKSDIYSFGVLLLEAITGRDPVDYARPSNEVSIIIRPFFFLYPNLMVVHVSILVTCWNFYFTSLNAAILLIPWRDLSRTPRYLHSSFLNEIASGYIFGYCTHFTKYSNY